MKKAIMALLGLLCVTIFLTHGKVLAEQTEPAISNSATVVEAPEVMETNSESVTEDVVPIQEELEDEEVIDSDA